MNRYLVLFKAGGSGPEEMGAPTAEQHAAWLVWKEEVGDAIVDFGAATIAVPGRGEGVGGYSIVQADTVGALEAIFDTNPHRRQGGTIEFYQILDIPGE